MNRLERHLNKCRHGDRATWAILAILLAISIVEVFTASSALSYGKENYYAPILGHIRYICISLCALFVAHIIPLDWVRRFCRPYTIFWFIVLAGLLVVGKDVNGSARWFNFLGINIQPSEFSKLGVIATSAYFISKGQELGGLGSRALINVLIYTGAACMLIFSENLSTALLLASVILLMLFIGNIRWKHLALVVGSVAAVGVVAYMLLTTLPANAFDNIPMMGRRAATWKARIENNMSKSERTEVPPELYDLSNNQQRADSNIAIARGSVVLPKFGQSVQRDHLSYAYSDFIYPIIVEEWGWLFGCLPLILLYILIFFRTISIAKKTASPFRAYLILGASLMIIMQAFIHMAVGADVIPITGQPLPLISRGGSSMVINCVYIGLLLNVSATNKLMAAEAVAEGDDDDDDEEETDEENNEETIA